MAADWPEPDTDADDDVTETMKILYMRNLRIQIPEDTIKNFGRFNPGWWRAWRSSAAPSCA